MRRQYKTANEAGVNDSRTDWVGKGCGIVLILLYVEFRNPPAESTEQVRGDRADLTSDVGYVDPGGAVLSVNGDYVADFGVGKVGYVQHGQIHGDNSDQRHALAVQ